MAAALWGRQAEMDRIESALCAAREVGTALVLEGEPGIGKTRLAAEAQSLARGLGLEVVVAAADELHAHRRLALFAPVAGIDAPTDAVDVLEAKTARRPVLLVVEDVHWADVESVSALRSIVRSLDRLACVVLMTTRPAIGRGEVAALLAEVSRRGAVLRLEPLSIGDAVGLAAATLGRELDDPERALVARGAGNPLFTIELAAALRPAGRPRASAARGPDLPKSVREIVERRLGALPPQTREALVTASVLGAAFSLAELGRVLDIGGVELYQRLRPALDDGLLRGEGERLAFSHHVVKDAVYEGVPIAVRRALHRSAALALRAGGMAPMDVAAHVAIAAERADPSSIELLFDAIREAHGRDWWMSVRLLERACELTAARSPGGTDCRTALAGAYLQIGRTDLAWSVLRDLERENASAREHPMFHVITASLLQRDGKVVEALDHRQRATLLGDQDHPGRMLGVGETAITAVLAGDAATAEATAREVLASVSPRDPRRAYALMAQSWLELSRGRVTRGVELAEEADILTAPLAAAHVGSPMVSLFRGVALAEADRLDEAIAVVSAGLDRAEGSGHYGRLPLQRVFLSMFHLFAGEVTDASASIDAAFGDDGGVQDESTLIAYAVVAHCALHVGDLARGRAAVETARRWSEGRSATLGRMWLETAAAMLTELGRETEPGLDRLVDSWRATSATRLLLFARDVAPTIARMAMATGRKELALEVATDVAGATEAPTARAVALHCSALAARDANRLRAAVTEYRLGRRPLLHARALEDLAATGSGSEGKDRSALSEAAAIYRRCGAIADLARICPDGATEASGNASSEVGQLHRLTPAERAVADLAAEGLTNKEIALQLGISRLTVETHMKRILAKLEVPNRTRLAVLLRGPPS